MKTPMQKLDAPIVGNEIYIKREDLLPFSFGGNKVRIAKEFFADMKEKEKNCMVGYGNARSNLCRILTNFCVAKNIPCYIISPADDNGDRHNTNNSIISNACGAQYVYCTKQNVEETVESTLKLCREQGLNPYYIYGNQYGQGNEATAALAYQKVYGEIRQQAKELGVEFDYIFLATGTGMTQAGLLLGKHAMRGREHIVGISVARERDKAENALKKYVASIETDSPGFDDLEVDDSYTYDEYGRYGLPILNVIREMQFNHGIALDPTYTGKAFWGMKEYLVREKIHNKRILFIHTGGTPLYFDLLKDGLFKERFIQQLTDTDEHVHKMVGFLTRWGGQFAVPIFNKVDLTDYSLKILKLGYAFAVVDSQSQIEGLIGGYANNYKTKVAFESVFVTSPRLRGSGAATLLFNRQLDYCRERNMKKIVFSTDSHNVAARHFYQKMGVTINNNQSTNELIQYEIRL